MQATIDALRSQLEVAHHQPLCASADSACAGTRFLDGDRSTCMRALDKAARSLEASLPTLSGDILQLSNTTSSKKCTGVLGDGDLSCVTPGSIAAQHTSPSVAGKHLQHVDVDNIIKELKQLHDVIYASSMFNNQVRYVWMQ